MDLVLLLCEGASRKAVVSTLATHKKIGVFSSAGQRLIYRATVERKAEKK